MTSASSKAVPDRDLAIENIPTDRLRPNPKNARVHPAKQINQIAQSCLLFGFVTAILVDERYNIIAGHGRYLAAIKLDLKTVPCIVLRGLTEHQKIGLAIADNKIALNSGWDLELLKEAIEFASIEIDLTKVGFEVAEQDIILAAAADDPGDDFIPAAPATIVTQPGDLWILDRHRLGCGDCRDEAFVVRVMAEAIAAMVFADAPYNVRVDGHVCGKGAIRHREFAMAAGEMSREEFIQFLVDTLGPAVRVSRNGAVHFLCMDHRHVEDITAAAARLYGARLNICVWRKSNAGMGSLYRSQHELVFVYRVGDAPHRNNVELGRHGRNRTNCWDYPSVNSFGSRQADLALHPSVKPVALVADAIKDVTKRDEVVFDPFMGSGTTLIACERTGRICRGIELDPAYVDVALARFQAMTGIEPVLASTGETFTAVAQRRHSELED
jgi:DNA modification methylase